MAQMRAQAKRVATSPKSDDLTLITGIGSAIAARLHDNGILTFAQLAALSPEDIASQVVGRTADRIVSEKWIQQARKLDPKVTSHQVQGSEATSEFRQHYATFTVELLLDEDNSVRRTRVAYVQNKLEETWAGWKQSKLTNFFAKSAGVKIPLLETDTSPLRTPESPHRENLPDPKPNDSFGGVLRASQLETIPLDSNMPQYIAHANEAFNVCILLDLTGVKTSPSIPLNCTITIWAKKFGEGERQIIGKQQSTFLPAENKPCVVESTIPSQGIYRLEALVTLIPVSISSPPHSAIKAWLESSLFKVL